MAKKTYQILIKPEAMRGPVRQQSYAADAWVDVRDLVTRAVVQLRAREISPYRHCLLMEGKVFEILNVAAAD